MKRGCLIALILWAASAALRAGDMVRVGLVQMDGKTFDKEYNLAHAEKGIREAAARGAKLALRKAPSGWNKVYGPENRYPAAYRRIGKE